MGVGRSRGALAVGAAASMLVAAPAYAAALPDTGDCIIVGPHYVSEVVDCAITILTLLDGIDDPI